MAPPLTFLSTKTNPRPRSKIFFETIQDFDNTLHSLNHRSAPGMDGWSIGLIRRICEINPLLKWMICQLVSAMMTSGWYPAVFFENRLIGIPKPGKEGKIRPITIPSAWRKLIAKSLLSLHHSELLSHVPYEQFGIGKRLASEAILSTITDRIDYNTLQHKETVVTQLDITSAFPSVDHLQLLRLLHPTNLNIHPSVYRFIQHALSRDSLYFCETETPTVIESTKGLPQGCPLSPILFSIFTSSTIRSVNARERPPPLSVVP